MANEFLNTYAGLANDIAERTGIDPAVILGIIDVETGGGKHVLSNNIFGISPGGKGGQYVARYPDVQTASEAFITLMQQPRYAKVTATPDPAAQAAALVAAGYNTVNPKYAAIVAGRAKQFGAELGYQDQQPAAPAPASGAAPAAPGGDVKTRGLAEIDRLIAGGKPDTAAAPAAPAAGGDDPRARGLAAIDARIAELGGAGEGTVTNPYAPPETPAFDGTIVVPQRATVEGGGVVGRIGTAAMQGAQQGAKEALTPAGTKALWSAGPIGQYIVHPLAQAAAGTLGAMGGGLAQSAYESGAWVDPKLGRDMVALSQVVPITEGMMRPNLRVPGAQEVARSPGPPASPLEARVREVAADARRRDGGEPPPGGGRVEVKPVDAGAAVTTEQIPEKTKPQRITDLDKDVGQTVLDRSVNKRDDNVYVEGIPPRLEVHRNFDEQVALDHKKLYMSGENTEYRKMVDDNIEQRNYPMSEMIKEEMGDGISVGELKLQRDAVTPDAMGVFKNEKPVDPALLDEYHAKLDALRERFSKDDEVVAILDNIQAKLHDRNGAREDLPSQLQKVRDMMTGKLEKSGGSDASAHAHRRARFALEQLVSDLNPVMMDGAPAWDAWRAQWAQISRQIDAQEFLQNYRTGTNKSLWDSKGLLVPRKVQQLVADIAAAHRLPTHKGQGLSDTQIQKIVNVRNEIEPYRLTEIQGRVPGSHSAQMFEAGARLGDTALGQTLQGIGDIGAHMLAGQVPGGNAIVGAYQVARPLLKARREARTAAQQKAAVDQLKARLLSQQVRNPLE